MPHLAQPFAQQPLGVSDLATPSEDQAMWRNRANRAWKFSDVANGIPFHSNVFGPDGMSFTLIATPDHSREDLNKASEELLRRHDVVLIQYVRPELAQLYRQYGSDTLYDWCRTAGGNYVLCDGQGSIVAEGESPLRALDGVLTAEERAAPRP